MTTYSNSNPLRQGLRRERAPEPCVFVVFGGAGDLSRRKLMPALYHLYNAKLLPREFCIVIYASPDWTDEHCRREMRDAVSKHVKMPITEVDWQGFARMISYVRRTGDMAESLERLKNALDNPDNEFVTRGNAIFYLATPPFMFTDTINGLGDVGLAGKRSGPGWRRIVVEKPFGDSLESARALNVTLKRVFDEDDIYRIDHYLGKETVQNILVFRFANEMIEPMLRAEHVDHIQVSVAETIGIEGRGDYYESAGALRDMIQNHALQLAALTCMDEPASLDPASVRDARSALLQNIVTPEPCRVGDISARGQYKSGLFFGEKVNGYKQEENVSPDSDTETYVALKLEIDNPRWRRTPVYLRTGKRLAKRATEVSIHFKRREHGLFGGSWRDVIEPNVISLNIQPDEGITVKLESKVPGLKLDIQPVRADFKYASGFGPSAPDAYERLILDVILGDTALYAGADATERSWEIIDSIRQGWETTQQISEPYYPGGWGPSGAFDLMERDRRKWRRL